MSLDCLSVGILVADHLCEPIPRLPAAGELLLTERLQLNIGGCASNAAMDMARIGVRVEVVGCVGEDIFGRFVIDTLTEGGVDTSSIKRLPGVGTSGTLIVNVAGEDRRFIHTIGANGRLRAADIPLERVRQAKVLYVGGYFITPGLDQDELVAVFRQARSWGVTTVLDVVLPGQEDYWPRLVRLLAETDVFLPNEDEGRIITGQNDPRRQALKFLDAGVGTVAITCGGQGTVLASKGLRVQAEAHRMQYVGGTGAGDAFDAGYIAGLVTGADPLESLAWGSALGASCVRSISATDSVFTRDEALAFIRENPLRISNW